MRMDSDIQDLERGTPEGLVENSFDPHQWGAWKSHSLLAMKAVEELGWQERYSLLSQCFRMFNRNVKGYMNYEEFNDALLRFPAVEEAFHDLFFQLFDRDRDGYLRELEFIGGMMCVSPEAPHQVTNSLGQLRTQYIFIYYDANRTGLLEPSEMDTLREHIVLLTKGIFDDSKDTIVRRDVNMTTAQRTSSSASSIIDRGSALLAGGIDKLQKYLNIEACAVDATREDMHLQVDITDMMSAPRTPIGYSKFFSMIESGELPHTNLLLRTKLDHASVIAGVLSGERSESLPPAISMNDACLALPPSEPPMIECKVKSESPVEAKQEIDVEVTVLRKETVDDFNSTLGKSDYTAMGRNLMSQGELFEKEVCNQSASDDVDQTPNEPKQELQHDGQNDNENNMMAGGLEAFLWSQKLEKRMDRLLDTEFSKPYMNFKQPRAPHPFETTSVSAFPSSPSKTAPIFPQMLTTDDSLGAAEEEFLSLTATWRLQNGGQDTDFPDISSPLQSVEAPVKYVEPSFRTIEAMSPPASPLGPTNVPSEMPTASCQAPMSSTVVSLRPVAYPTVPAATVALARRLVQEAQNLSRRCATNAGCKSSFAFLAPEDVVELCNGVVPLFFSEDSLVHLRTPAKVFGSLHGDLKNLLTFFELYGWPEPAQGDICSFNYVFLGNYVDLGKCSYELMILLMACKILSPSRMFLLRGNHEDRRVNCSGGFRAEILRKFGSPSYEGQKISANSIWSRFCDMFEYMPLAALIDKDIFCIHGAVGNKVEAITDLSRIKKPIVVPPVPTEFQKGEIEALYRNDENSGESNLETLSISNQRIMECLWANPMPQNSFASVKGNQISCDDIVAFANRNKIRLIIRGHQCILKGFHHYNDRIVNVFSAADLQEIHGNDGAILSLTKGQRGPSKNGNKNCRQLFVDAKVVKYSTIMEEIIADPGSSFSNSEREASMVSDMSAGGFADVISKVVG